MTALTTALLLALLSLYPGPRSRDITRRHDAIVEMASDSASVHNVPVAVLLSVAFLETHLGTDRGEGGGWGAPINRRHRHTAGTSDDAARVLERSYAVCGTWRGAIARFRSGLCREPARMHPYVENALRMVTRISLRAGVPPPDLLQRSPQIALQQTQ